MKQSLKWIGFILFAAIIGLALSVAFVAGVRAQSPVAVVQRAITQATPPAPYTGPWGYGGWGSYSSTGVYTPTQPLPHGMMGPGMHGGMGGYSRRNWATPGKTTPLTLDQATEAARQYLSAYANPDLALAEVMEFSDNFYAEVEEESTGIHAFEVLIDRYTGAVYPEPGPNMMWNAKYGHMGSGLGQSGGTMTVTPEQARTSAQQWLDVYLPGTTVAEAADAFYGYYTIHVLKDGQVYGMLSVNGYTGDVWYHTWHGDFVAMKEVEE